MAYEKAKRVGYFCLSKFILFIFNELLQCNYELLIFPQLFTAHLYCSIVLFCTACHVHGNSSVSWFSEFNISIHSIIIFPGADSVN